METRNVNVAVPIGKGSRGRGRGFRLVSGEGPGISGPKHDVEFTDNERTSTIKDAASGPVLTQLDCTDTTTQVLENVGVNGKRCYCFTNFVKLTRTEAVSVYEYIVSFKPILESTKVKIGVLKQLEGILGSINVFDGQTLYLPKKMLNELSVVNCVHPNLESEVSVTLKFIKEKTVSEELTQFYNTLFQRMLLDLGFLQIRRGFYKTSEIREMPRERLQVWPGVSLTVEVKDGGLMVMIDSPSRILRTETLYDFYKQFQNRDGDKNSRETFEAFAVGKIILCEYSKQCYKIDDVAWDLNPNSYFTYRRQEITYREYFQEQYNVNIKHLEQPLVVSKIRPRSTLSMSSSNETVRVIALVPELCHVTGLTSEQRSNFKLVTEISAITRLNPRLRISAMNELLREIKKSSKCQKILEHWGLRLEDEVLGAIGRQINPPTLQFDEMGDAKLVSANFSKEACRSCLHPVPVTNFLVFCVQKDMDCAKHFLVEYSEACSSLGVKLRTNGEIVEVKSERMQVVPSDFVKKLEQSCMNCEKVQFVVVILPFYREDVYRAIKKFCLTVCPIPSQCVMSKTLRHKSIKKVAINICLQINCKLGGSLWGLKMPVMKKVMVIGMDAAHDPTRKNPSVIALVATLNEKCSAHFSRCSFQPIHQEVCTSLRTMFKDALDAYIKYNAGELPDRIIFYRDGGSAGTFEVLKKYEIDVCMDVLKEDSVVSVKTVNFSYICVAKRIPQRMFLKTEGLNVENPPPGTVLDHGITTPSRYDFYIVSQKVHQGTVNPTHYSVLYETKATKADVMQKISYAMTYMYYNWQGTIKVPSVIQYSHKLGQLVSRIQALPNRSMAHNLYFL